MKKVLAIVLTLAMLLSSMIVGLSAAQVVTENKTDNYYYNYPSGSSYCPISLGNQDSNFDVEMDIRLDASDANLGNCYGLAVNPVFSATSVGVEGAVVNGNYEVDRWYHVKWDNNGDGTTTVYVDGAKVGTVNKVVTLWDHDGDKVAFWSWNVISIDNLRIGTYFNDMEKSGPIAYDHNDTPTQGGSVEYVIKVDSIFDHFETKEVGGSAILLEQTPVYGVSDINTYLDSGSFRNDGFKVNQGSFIMNFDLAVLPVSDSTEGSCFEMWTNKDRNGTNLVRWKVGVMPTADGLKGFVGTESGSTKDFIQFDWGEATINNFKNVTYFIDFEHNIGQIYIDKQLAYESKAGAKAWDNMIFMPHNASTVLDNIQLMDLNYNSLGGTEFSSDVAKTIKLDAEDLCAANGHINGKLERTEAPRCFKEGNDAIYCAVCGAVKSNTPVAMVPHNYAGYNINNKTEDGLVYTFCKNADCVERRYTTLPDKSTYTGTLYEYHDMSDDMAIVIDNSWNSSTWSCDTDRGVLVFGGGTGSTSADGKFTPGNENNYNIYYTVSNVNANNWSWNIDMIYNGTFDTVGGSVEYEDGKPGYGHVLYFWCGGADTVTAQIGYNADKHKLFLVPNNGGPNQADPFPSGNFSAKTVDFTMVEGESYNFAVSMSYFKTDDEAREFDQYASLKLFVNGVEYIDFSFKYLKDENGNLVEDDWGDPIEVGSASAFFNLPYAKNTLDYVILRDFGISFDVDAMAIGSADFAYTNRTYAGDLDGDYTLTAADTLAMRKYLARVYSDKDILTSRADANGDGAINAKDQLVMRKALMG